MNDSTEFRDMIKKRLQTRRAIERVEGIREVCLDNEDVGVLKEVVENMTNFLCA